MSCYRPSVKALKYLLRFCLSFEFKVWFANLGERGPMGVGLHGVRRGVSDFLQMELQAQVSVTVLLPCLI